MRRKSEEEINARFNASTATNEEVKYIVKMRKRMTQTGYLLWAIIGVLIYIYWSYLNWWLILIGGTIGLILGGLVSFITGKIVESKTGHDLQTQMQIYKNYQQGKYS
jgi:hypothetical protein